MAGQIVRVVPKTFVTFANIPISPPNPTWFWLARRINVSQWRELTLYVRVHPGSSITNSGVTGWGIGAQAGTAPAIQVYADGYTDEDPSVFATTTSTVSGFVAKLGTDTTLNPSTTTTLTTGMSVIAVNANAGALLAIALYAKQPGGGGAVQQAGDIYISIDLSGKE